MAFNINTFRSEGLRGDGARPTLFEVEITFPSAIQGEFPTLQTKLMAKASTLPGSTIGMIEVPYFGRKIKVAGDRTFDDWTITIINDESFDIRNAFEHWQDSMDQYSTNANLKRIGGATASPLSYVADIQVHQYGKQGKIIKSYKLKNAFPTQVGQVDVSWENNDQIEEFDVTFSLDYFQPTNIGAF